MTSSQDKDYDKGLATRRQVLGDAYVDAALAKATHTQDASYLDVIHTGADDETGEWNPTDYAYHLTRRARGLPLAEQLADDEGRGVRRHRRELQPELEAALIGLLLRLGREPRGRCVDRGPLRHQRHRIEAF